MGFLHLALSLCCLVVLGVFSLGRSSFTPVDCFLIGCGNSKSVEFEDGRVFQPDYGNSNVGLFTSSHVVVSDSGRKGLSDLYNSARVFATPSTYTIRNNQSGRHWLRLHFYPVKNNDYDLKASSFSVVANGITLLHRFSHSQNGPLVKEYVVEVNGSGSDGLSLTLSPRLGSVAFINGLEVISVPKGQFDFGVVPIPKDSSTTSLIPSSTALETVYRLNMGGSSMTSENDPFWRDWKSDYPFLVHPSAAVNVSTDPRLVKYAAGVTVEIAPDWVYATVQEMAEAQVVEPNFNLTWVFGVDPGYTYFLRMHFCDIVSDALGELIFNVYVNEYIAVDSLDISAKTTALSVAYFLDFTVNISEGGSENLYIKVGPSTSGRVPVNAILNGLEIMRLSDSSSLDVNIGMISGDYYIASKTKKHMMIVAFACLGSLVIFLLVLISCCFFYVQFSNVSEKVKPKTYVSWVSNLNTRSWDFILKRHHVDSGLTPTFGVSPTFASSMPTTISSRHVFSFADILVATKSFDNGLAIGVGGFGKVYKGMLENGVMVAVKRGSKKSQQGLLEFRTEIMMLSKLRHKHLVSLIGFCEEMDEMILVYEFMAGGPLRKHLYSEPHLPALSWKQRLEICIGAAKGLHYLHTGAASERIIHRDVKTTNILLDENLKAKVSDFGLSKFGPALDQTHVSTAVKGSFGYLDPEYYRRQQLTEKSDVYSFGVVLMEVLCARPPINPTLPREQVNIAEWAMQWQKAGRVEEIIDPRLLGKVNERSLRKFGETAAKCLGEYGSDRPSMGDVLRNLEHVLKLQEACGLVPHTESGESSTAEFSEILNKKEDE
ncbi:unnamed protein product [Cuscuta epithymum]|uniref:Protein kinase domain-containing protein n=1 Tax=Cuscuta epithymum TaxID=186058 RepID=A0AAV0EBF5_9ASTE|nr:unnamed protein product [Cuscuta epithymum]